MDAAFGAEEAEGVAPEGEGADRPQFMDPTLEKLVVRNDELAKIGDEVKQEFKARATTRHRWRLQKLNRLKEQDAEPAPPDATSLLGTLRDPTTRFANVDLSTYSLEHPVQVRKLKPPRELNKPALKFVKVMRPTSPEALLRPSFLAGPRVPPAPLIGPLHPSPLPPPPVIQPPPASVEVVGPRVDQYGDIVEHSLLGGVEEFQEMDFKYRPGSQVGSDVYAFPTIT